MTAYNANLLVSRVQRVEEYVCRVYGWFINTFNTTLPVSRDERMGGHFGRVYDQFINTLNTHLSVSRAREHVCRVSD